MKQVYQCDFCSKTDRSAMVILQHESVCSFNPALRSCCSCKHWNVTYGDFPSESCDKKVSTFFEIHEDTLTCDKWEE